MRGFQTFPNPPRLLLVVFDSRVSSLFFFFFFFCFFFRQVAPPAWKFFSLAKKVPLGFSFIPGCLSWSLFSPYPPLLKIFPGAGPLPGRDHLFTPSFQNFPLTQSGTSHGLPPFFLTGLSLGPLPPPQFHLWASEPPTTFHSATPCYFIEKGLAATPHTFPPQVFSFFFCNLIDWTGF